MSQDVSSSSDDEASVIETPSPQKRRKLDRPTRYQCPADFVSFAHKPCSSTLIDNVRDENTELWLIKAPSSFNPESFSSLKIPLSGLQTVQSQTLGARAQIYSVLAGSSGATDLRLVTSHCQEPDSAACAPVFSGLLNICESYGDCSSNQAPIAIAATLPPTIPPGLRQRFQPFGSRTPTLAPVVTQDDTTQDDTTQDDTTQDDTPPLVSQPTPVRVKEEQEVVVEERKRKKKKRKDKDKQIKVEEQQQQEQQQQEEQQQHQEVKEERVPVAQEAGLSEEKRKKKKKKRDRGEVEDTVYPGVSVKQEVEVKMEPMDISYGDLMDSGKKKKKKKKIRTGDD